MTPSSTEPETRLVELLQDASRRAEAGEWEHALFVCRQILERDNKQPLALYLAAVACISLAENQSAIDYLCAAAEVEPDANKCALLAPLLIAEDRIEEAIVCLEHWSVLAPDDTSPRNQLGALYAQQGRIGEAIAQFRASLRLAPENNIACAGLYPLLRTACAWGPELDGLARGIEALNAAALSRGEMAPEPPFDCIHRSDDSADNLAVARSWSRTLFSEIDRDTFPARPKNDDRGIIRLGYLSADFHDHATAHLMAGIFPAHDRQRFSVHGYSYGPDDGSAYRSAIRQGCDRFYDIRDASDHEAAERIYRDEIDILIDLKGYTRHHRLQICAQRPAPVQVTYLGYPGTTGADFFDYALTDEIVTPPDVQKYYAEKLVFLPNTYQCNDNSQETLTKSQKHNKTFSNQFKFIFSSFNNPTKIEPSFFNIWMELLESVPNSGLIILQNNALTEENLRREAEKRGIAGERILFAEMLPRAQHLQRMADADLALDTRYYNGHTTTSDALWAGLPVVTMKGRHFASRVSASLLRAMELPELIANSPSEYREIAYGLASNPATLAKVRAKIAANRRTTPLFDTERFTRGLETAFIGMWKRYLQGEPPAPFAVGHE